MTEIKDAKLRDLNVTAERAQTRYEEGTNALLRPDGSKLYADDEHRERVQVLEQERNEVLGEVEHEAHEIRVAVESEIEIIENADPTSSLSSDELEQANLRRAFAMDAAETLSLEAFGKRLASVLAAGDKGSIFAYLVAGQRKSADRGGRVPFRDVLGEMAAALGGDRRAAAVESARHKEGEAFQVEQLAHNLKTGARTSAEAFMNQKYARA